MLSRKSRLLFAPPKRGSCDFSFAIDKMNADHFKMLSDGFFKYEFLTKYTNQPSGLTTMSIVYKFHLQQFLKKLWCCVGGRVNMNFGFIKRVDKARINNVKDMES